MQPQGELRYEGARAVLRVPGVRGIHLHEALAAFNSGRMCDIPVEWPVNCLRPCGGPPTPSVISLQWS